VNLPVRLLVAALALTAAAVPRARAQEADAAKAEEAAPKAGAGSSFRLQYAYCSTDVGDGEVEVCLVEAVSVSLQPGFLLQARNVVLWVDAEKARDEGGDLSRLVAAGGGGRKREAGAEKPPPSPPPVPGVNVPGDLRRYLGPVLIAFYAEGDVVFRLGTRTIRTDRLYVDFRRNLLSTGRITMTLSIGIPSRGQALPLVVRADRMRRVSEDTLRLEGVEYTTCDFEEPHYSMKATTFDITEHEEYRAFTAWGSVLRVEGIPLMYFPYLAGSSELSARPLRKATISRSSRFGFQALLLWGDDITAGRSRWGEWRLRTDWRSRRGPGIGPELQYDHGDYEGELLTYYQRDRARTDSFDDSPVPREDRGRVRWEHRQRLGEGLRLDLSLFDFSDRNFQREFLKDEALEDRDPETYANLLWRRGTDFASISAKLHVDDFRTETTELPDVALRRVAAPVPLSLVPAWLLDGATYSLDFRGGAYERVIDEAAGIRGDRELREDGLARLEGHRWVGPISLAPFGLAGATRWQGLERPGGGGGRNGSRGDLAAGLRASIEARRDFPDAASALLDVKGLRHVVSLEALGYDRTRISKAPAGIGAVDRIDALEEVRVAQVRLRNRLQTTRGGRRVDWIDLELRGLWFPDGLPASPSPLLFREEGIEEGRFADFVGEEKYRASAPPGERGPAEADLRVRLRENLYVIGEAEYDVAHRNTITTAQGVRWYLPPDFSVYVGRRVIAGDSDIYTASLDWFPSERWGFRLAQQTDFRNNAGLKTEIGVHRVWHDFVLEVHFKRDQSTDDTSIGFSIVPFALWTQPTSTEKLGRLDFEAQRWYR
jgi:hypothetical protein